MANNLKRLDSYLVPGKHIHLIGIGGVSMRPLGLVLRGMRSQRSQSHQRAEYENVQ